MCGQSSLLAALLAAIGPVAELRKTQINIVKWKGILKTPSAAAIRQLNTEGGKPENPEKSPRSTGETNYNNSTHMSSGKLRINTAFYYINLY